MLSLSFLVDEFDPFTVYGSVPSESIERFIQSFERWTNLAHPYRTRLGRLTRIRSVLVPNNGRLMSAASSEESERLWHDQPIYRM